MGEAFLDFSCPADGWDRTAGVRAGNTDETPKQNSEKVQELAALASVRPVDSVIGSGDLLHIDVFDVPELSRDVRVSDTGDISYPLIPGKITVAGLTSFQLESKIEQLAHRERIGVASASFGVRQGTK